MDIAVSMHATVRVVFDVEAAVAGAYLALGALDMPIGTHSGRLGAFALRLMVRE